MYLKSYEGSNSELKYIAQLRDIGASGKHGAGLETVRGFVRGAVRYEVRTLKSCGSKWGSLIFYTYHAANMGALIIRIRFREY